ncbi:MAG: FtsK/SpoIIIE domain-containing protein [Verrucomicrobiota bacterium]|nr:FtsK/SpoIIIE domain-containing protein [Verrucomicrobiota bacterium]
MSNNPSGTNTTLEIVRRFSSTVIDCAEREDSIESNYRLRTARAKREYEEGLSDLEASHQGSLAEAQSVLHNRRERAKDRYNKRGSRIEEAHSNALNKSNTTLETERGRKISEVQAKTLEAKRKNETALSEAKKIQTEIDTVLEHHVHEFKLLRKKALASFRGFPLVSRKLKKEIPDQGHNKKKEAPDLPRICTNIEKIIKSTNEKLKEFDSNLIPKVFRFLPLQWLAPITAVGIFPLGHYILGWSGKEYLLSYGIAALCLLSLWIIKARSSRLAKDSGEKISEQLIQIRASIVQCDEGRNSWIKDRENAIEEELEKYVEDLNDNLGSAIENAEEIGMGKPKKLEKQLEKLRGKNSSTHSLNLENIQKANEDSISSAISKFESEKEQLAKVRDSEIEEAETEHKNKWEKLVSEWKNETETISKWLSEEKNATSQLFPEWGKSWLDSWSPPDTFPHCATFGSLELDPNLFGEGPPKSPSLKLPDADFLKVPLNIRLPQSGSILFETESSGDSKIVNSINNIILRLLSVAPAGKLSFSIFDPVGLGQNFASITHLSDYEDSIINKRIWTQREQIETRIMELNEHMEKVIQMYLRNEYETITDYNEKAGNIAEKYHFLVIADFPTNFSEVAARGLMSIAANGARCGIYTLIHWDKRQALPEALDIDDLRKSNILIEQNKEGRLSLVNGLEKGTSLHLESPPGSNDSINFVQRIGDESSNSNRIEVPFSHIIPNNGEYWSGDTSDELKIPIGRTGATKLQYLSIGKGTKQHALLAGKTGSGKSTLFHVMITNLALHFGPDQVEFYLVDFKKGVEFKSYGAKKLPHAKVVAIESDREFGLSVLQKLDHELKERGELFRKVGAQDIAGYKRSSGESMPRTLLLIDEFQEFFVEDDKIAQQASVLLDRIVRQGRAFGIHVVLGSQTLGGAYSLARATLGQMVIRIALMCNEADAYLIMDEGNPAPRLLTRPGEGIYNDSAGAIEGNSPFQTVWLSEQERNSHLDHINALNESTGNQQGSPIVFEGNAPADVTENRELAALLKESVPTSPSNPKIWLGAPNAIKGPTEVIFQRQSGNHLLLVGQRDDAIMAIMSIAIVSLSAQFSNDDISFIFIDSIPQGSNERDTIAKYINSISSKIDTNFDQDASELIQSIGQEIKRRESSTNKNEPPVFIFINGLQKFKKLRYDEELAYSFDDSSKEGNPALILNEIITEGPPLGIHLIVAIDSYNNIGRTLSRKALSEFEMRILFQMSANDSAALIDSTKASSIGMHRALFYSEQEGYLETFRPYHLPSDSWIQEKS